MVKTVYNLLLVIAYHENTGEFSIRFYLLNRVLNHTTNRIPCAVMHIHPSRNKYAQAINYMYENERVIRHCSVL